MSADKKDLKYFLDHPDEMPEDPKELERLTNEHMQHAMESGQEQLTVDRFVAPDEKKDGAASSAKVEEPAKDEAEAKAAADATAKEAEAKAAADAATAAEAAKAAEAKPDGILAKDGKNIIPYGQLESARDRAKAAEATVKAQAERIAALEAEKKPAADVTDVEMLTEEELKVLEADSPTLAKTLRAQQAAIQKLSETVQSVTERQAEQVATEESVVKTEIQTAIDANPALAAWQTAEDQSMWNQASAFDKVLRENPKYADMPFADRFAKVVELTQSALGVEAPAKIEAAKPALTAEETRAAAAAKLAEKNKTAKPVSMSQIPGGAPPAVDEREKVEQMSAVALGQQFMSMTPEQRDAYLATL